LATKDYFESETAEQAKKKQVQALELHQCLSVCLRNNDFSRFPVEHTFEEFLAEYCLTKFLLVTG
jgi:hypothetical protein